MTRLERARAIGNRILSLSDDIWTPTTVGDIDANITVQQGWSAAVTATFPDGMPHDDSAAEAAGNENDYPFSFVLDVWVTGKGKVLSLDCGLETKLISMRPGPWEQELFGIANDPQSEASSALVRAVDPSRQGATEALTQSARESRCRRRAANFGLRLHKSRRDLDRGHYALIDMATNLVVYGSDGSGTYDATLDDIETYLTRH